ncbi:MAG: hypothetical protein IJS53_02720 [Clostridia bacterium]|nr:hypothetical protein [Clostridia bacterium]
MKRLLLFLALALLLSVPAALAEGYVLEEGPYSLTFNEQGCLMRLENRETGTVYAACDYTNGYRLWFDLEHSDMWDCGLYNVYRCVVTGNSARSTEARTLENGIAFTHVFQVKTGTVVFTQEFCVEDGLLRVHSHVDNSALAKGTLMIVEPLILTGLEGDELSFLWPYQEGEIYENALEYVETIGDTYSAAYPGVLSTQFVALFDEEESLYYGVHDETAAHKVFSLSQSKSTGLTELCAQLCPFVEAGKSQDLPDVVIQLASENGWMAAADAYRGFLEEAGWASRRPEALENFTGWYNAVLAYPGGDFRAGYTKNNTAGLHTVMSDYVVASQKLTGVGAVMIEGWQNGGATAQYPDFAFSEILGGEGEFKKGMDAIHEAGGLGIVYVNVHAAETTSQWYALHGEDAATRTDAGGVFGEFHWSGYEHVGMCPGSQDFIDAIVDACVRLRAAGADGFYFGQMMSASSALCFNRNHNHSTPATNFAEGYAAMMTAVDEAMAQFDGETIYAAEGVVDCYLPYLHICGNSIFRPANHSLEAAPQVARYTLQNTIHLGIWSNSSNTRAQYGVAFSLGEPYLVTATFNEQLSQFTDLYRAYPDIFFRGSFEYLKGVSGVPEGCFAGLIRSDSENRAALQLFMPSGWPEDVSISVEGLGENIAAVNGLTGEELSVTEDGRVEFMLLGWTPVSIIFEGK